jgi:hypothetical protein
MRWVLSEYQGGDAGGGAVDTALSPEAVLESLSAQANEAAIFPGSLREQYLFAYDLLLDQGLIGRFIKGQLAPRIVQLQNHRLVWPYYHPPAQSVLPSIERTNRTDDVVWGVIYEMRRRSLTELERYLRVPNRYHRHAVSCLDRGGRRFTAFTYVLTMNDPVPGKPSAEYREQLLSCAGERELPTEWLETLRGIETVEAAAAAS